MNWQPMSAAPQCEENILLCRSYQFDGKTEWFYGVGIWYGYRNEWLFHGDEDDTPELWCWITPPTEQAP